MNPLAVLPGLAAVIAIAMSVTASAQSTFRISQVFSNLDGSVQYISLTETAGLDNQGVFKGLTLTITHAGVAKQFTFYDNLATFKTAHLTIVVAATPDVVPAPAIPYNSGNFVVLAHPDFVVPARFVAADGGTVDFAGFDGLTYPALPSDGSTAWYRDGTFARGKLPGNYGCGLVPSSSCPGVVSPTPTLASAIEYYNPDLDRYFITASAAEIDALDQHRLAGWQRTGESMAVGQVPATRLDLEYEYDGTPVCRFYLPPGNGDSHFFSASANECAAVRSRFPEFVEETMSAFYAALPSPGTGDCGVLAGYVDGPLPLTPVYRLWRERAGGDHRYTTSTAIRDAMIADGWISEGHGPLGVVMCV